MAFFSAQIGHKLREKKQWNKFSAYGKCEDSARKPNGISNQEQNGQHQEKDHNTFEVKVSCNFKDYEWVDRI